jgi:hypothetical protein
VISVERVRELIELGNENRNLDYKGAFSWNQATNDEKCEIAKDILAFSNTRDGGMILVGVNDKSGTIEGLTEEQYASFDQTKFNDFVYKYTDPHHTSNVHRIVVADKRLVAIDVPEFSEIPVLCARDANSSLNPSKLILRKSGLYIRTEKATSQLIEDADVMRELLNRGLLRRQDELLRAIKQIILPSVSGGAAEPEAQFKAEVESAQAYFADLNDAFFAQSPHWTVQMQPETHVPDRIPTAVALQRLVQESAISLRGWTFPIAGRVSGATWANFDGGCQSYYGGDTHSPEALRVYKSGLLLWTSGIWEDYWDSFKDQNVISFIGLIYSVTEWLLFAKRFYESVLLVDESVRLVVRASGIKGRKLISADPRVSFFFGYQTDVPSFEIREVVAVSELRADPEAIARRVLRRIFELFNWNDPDENMLHNWQQKLILRQY